MKVLQVILFLLLSLAAFAQANLSGVVILEEDDSPASGAFVSLVLTDSVSMKKFTAADGDGIWQIKNIPKGDYLLNVRYLGRKELFYPVVVSDGDSLHVTLKLQADALLLNGVEVKGDAIGITQSGDTLKFNLKYFSTGTEVNLGDVLNQLPGVEVADDGTVKYAGKKVDKLLVHGKDILNNKHRLATESIRADQLEGVHVINDYRDSKDIETKKSGKTALDVRIKKSEREKWSGQLQGLAGYDKKWALDLGAFQVGEKLGATLFAKANNAGEQTMSAQDYLGLKGFQILNKKMKRYGTIDDIFPKSFRIAPQTTKNLDAIIAGGLDYDFNETKSIKGDFMLAQLNRNEQEFFHRTYLGTKDVWSGQQLTESAQPILGISVLAENKISKQFFIEMGLSANYEKNDFDKQIKGYFNLQDFELDNHQAKKQWGFVPEIKMKYFPNDKIRTRWQISYSTDEKQRALDLTDIVPFLGLNLAPQNGLYSFEQSLQYRTQKAVSFADATYELKKAWYWGIEATNEIGRYQKDYLATATSFAGRVQLAQNLNSYKLKLVLDTTNWLIKTGLSLADNRVQLDSKTEKIPLKLLPNLTLKYLFSRLNFIMFTLNSDLEMAPEQYGHSILEAVDSRQSQAYDIDWQKTSNRQSYALSYLKFGLARGGMIYALVTYSTAKNPIGTNVVAQSDYAQMQLIRLPEQKTFNARLNFRNRVTKHLFAKASYDLMDVDGFSAHQNEISGFHRTRHHFSLGLSSKWKKKINYKVNYSLNLTNQRFGINPTSRQYIRHVPAIELSYGNKEGFLWKSNLGYRQSSTQSASAKNWKLDTDITYKRKKSKFRYFIKGRNLLSLTPTQQIDVRFSPAYIEEISYRNFPGYVMAGLSKDF